jgi:hypothetical protein
MKIRDVYEAKKKTQKVSTRLVFSSSSQSNDSQRKIPCSGDIPASKGFKRSST